LINFLLDGAGFVFSTVEGGNWNELATAFASQPLEPEDALAENDSIFKE
jgi:hypothetical protein